MKEIKSERLNVNPCFQLYRISPGALGGTLISVLLLKSLPILLFRFYDDVTFYSADYSEVLFCVLIEACVQISILYVQELLQTVCRVVLFKDIPQRIWFSRPVQLHPP